MGWQTKTGVGRILANRAHLARTPYSTQPRFKNLLRANRHYVLLQSAEALLASTRAIFLAIWWQKL